MELFCSNTAKSTMYYYELLRTEWEDIYSDIEPGAPVQLVWNEVHSPEAVVSGSQLDFLLVSTSRKTSPFIYPAGVERGRLSTD